MFQLVFLCYKVPCLAPLLSGAGLVLASDFQRTLAFSLQTIPLVPSESGCKSTAFSITRNAFFHLFFFFSATACVTGRKIYSYSKSFVSQTPY